jgi:hypothetical protein
MFIVNFVIVTKFPLVLCVLKTVKMICNSIVYSERQKYGINSLKIKQNFFQKNRWTGQF